MKKKYKLFIQIKNVSNFLMHKKKTKSERKMEADERVLGSVGMYRARTLGENVALSKEVSGRCFEREYSVICCLSWLIWWWR